MNARSESPLSNGHRVPFLDVAVDVLTFNQSLDACVRAVESGIPAEHVVINAGKCVLAHDDPELAEMIRSASIINADGQSVVWASSLLGTPLPERVAGIDLMQALLGECARRHWPVFFLGARQSVLDEALPSLVAQHPGLHIAGSHHGYFDDDNQVAALISRSGARVVFIAMSSPMKERFVAEHRITLGPVLTFGVGGSLDVVAGRTTRAPRWMQRVGLEWLHRLAQEPGRMWQRYLVGNSRFIALVGRYRLTSRKNR